MSICVILSCIIIGFFSYITNKQSKIEDYISDIILIGVMGYCLYMIFNINLIFIIIISYLLYHISLCDGL